MHILITGGTGFIGRHLIPKLKPNHQLSVLTRNPEHAKRILPSGVTLLNSLSHISHFNDIDAVINLAGEPIANKRWSQAQKEKICHSRWQMTSELVEKIKTSTSRPKVFISGSAVGYYGRQAEQPITESNYKIHDEFSHYVCKQWEEIALQGKDFTRVCLLRTGIVLGHNEGALAKMNLPFKLGLGGKIGSGQQYMSWIHIDDMVSSIMWLLNNPTCVGAFNLTAPNPVTNKEFVNALAKAVHRPAILPIPAAALSLIMGEAADLLLTGQNVLPQHLLETGFQFHYATIDKALSAIY
jgi:uncharacterized protein (TIGR01777 family)